MEVISVLFLFSFFLFCFCLVPQERCPIIFSTMHCMTHFLAVRQLLAFQVGWSRRILQIYTNIYLFFKSGILAHLPLSCCVLTGCICACTYSRNTNDRLRSGRAPYYNSPLCKTLALNRGWAFIPGWACTPNFMVHVQTPSLHF